MLYLIALVLLVTVTALWWLQTHQSTHDLIESATGRSPRNSYRCVEACPGNAACKAARNLGNIRFLYQEAPRLPVPGCTEQQCTCGFIYHDDRREHPTRKPDALREGHPYATVGARRTRNAPRNVHIVHHWSHPADIRSKDKGRETSA